MSAINSQRLDGVSEIIPGLLVVPTGGRVTYVHNAGAAALDSLPPGMQGNPDGFYQSLNAAMATCRPNRGDVICELPGHVENHTTGTELSNLVAGVRVIGVSNGVSDMPVHSFANTAAQWAINKNGVVFENIKLDLGQANGVVKALAVTGADVVFDRCLMKMATDSTHKATIGIEVGSGATGFRLRRSELYGASGIAVTDGVKFVGATVPSNFRIEDCLMQFAATEVNGLVHVTVAALDGLIRNCVLANTVASSTACVVIDNVASTGFAVNVDCADLNNGTATAQGFILGASSLWRFSRTYETNEPNKNSIVSPAAGT